MSSDAANQPDPRTTVQTLFIKHGPAIRGYLLALVPEESTADDLLHEVFLAVTAKADQYQPGTNFAAWARAIARFEALRLARDRAKAPTSLSPEVIEKISETSPAFEYSEDRLHAMQECLDRLAPQARKAIRLRYMKALAPKEIAGQMGLAVRSVSVMLARARVTLRECIDRKLKLGEEG